MLRQIDRSSGRPLRTCWAHFAFVCAVQQPLSCAARPPCPRALAAGSRFAAGARPPHSALSRPRRSPTMAPCLGCRLEARRPPLACHGPSRSLSRPYSSDLLTSGREHVRAGRSRGSRDSRSRGTAAGRAAAPRAAAAPPPPPPRPGRRATHLCPVAAGDGWSRGRRGRRRGAKRRGREVLSRRPHDEPGAAAVAARRRQELLLLPEGPSRSWRSRGGAGQRGGAPSNPSPSSC